MPSIHLISLGCSKNLVDSEQILGILADRNYHYSPVAEGVDVVFVNTCGFLQAAIDESFEVIEEMLELKRAGQVRYVVVGGCMPQRPGIRIRESLPEVDLVLGTGNYHKIGVYLEALTKNSLDARTYIDDPEFIKSDCLPRLRATLPHTSFLKISEGCSRTCAFCIIPTLRGKGRSKPIASLVDEATALVESGVVELNLIAQDLTAYGSDLKPRIKLAALLGELAQIEGLRWIRLHYAYPHGFDDELIATIRDEHRILPYLDMPIQHIDDGILKRMRRSTRESTVRDLLTRLKHEIPRLTLRTTLIVGFPGETEHAFQKLVSFVEEARFDRLGLFQFSQEPGTAAATMPDQIDAQMKDERYQTIHEVQHRVSLAQHAQRIGQTSEVLIEHTYKNPDDASALHYVGRLQSQAPEVDGKTVIRSTRELEVGSIHPVLIEGAGAYDFVASTDHPISVAGA